MRLPDYERFRGYVAVDGIASPHRSRSRPNVISVTSGCDANDKGNRRAKVMPGLSAGFSYWSRNASVG